jgi:hypothetical protein
MQQHVDVYNLKPVDLLAMPYWQRCEVIAQLPKCIREGIYRLLAANAVPA